MIERVILVDADDNAIGSAEKMQAHRSPQLHRAFSVFVFNPRGELLLHRRAADKYHSAGLWTNTCCGHPRPGEETNAAAVRRLREEMGITCELQQVQRFEYRARVGKGWWEHEVDHVLVGMYDGAPVPDPAEVGAWRWPGVDRLLGEVRRAPRRFTAWFAPALDNALAARLAS
jgi:isopentenyl-diphosphate delta-isomerase